MIQDIDDGRRHGFVGVRQEDADLPHLGVAELGFEAGHASKADTVLYLPVRFADRVIADTDDSGVVVMRLKEGRRIRILVLADGGGTLVKAVAKGAAIDVDVRPGGEIGGIGFHVRADEFALDPRIERYMHEALFVGEGRIIDCNGNLSVREVSQDRKWNKDDTDDQPKQESHVVS